MDTPFTLQRVLRESAERHADRPFLAFVGDHPRTFAQVAEAVAVLCHQLHLLGVREGDRVAILSHNMPNWGVAYLAVTTMGAVAVPILPDFHENEIENILSHSGSSLLFVSTRLYPKVEHVRAEALRTIVLVNNFSTVEIGTSADALHSAIPLTWPEGPAPGIPDIDENDLASIIYTSGTTGTSKGVMLTHRNIVWDAWQATMIQEVTKDDVLLSILPLSHSYENTVGFVIPLMQGASVYYLDRPPTASVLLPALGQVRPTFMLSVPMVIEKIYRHRVLPELTKSGVTKALYGTSIGRRLLHRIAGRKLMRTFGGRLRFFGIGGAKLDPATERFLADARFPYAIGYGLTETAPIVAGATPHRVRFQSTGPALPGVQLRIANADPASGEGEIEVRGDNVMKGYYKAEELTAQVFTGDGWFRTGDLGVLDSDGHLTIKGRLKNMIVGPSGENIYPEEIEYVINNFEYVVESLVAEKEGKLVAMVHFNREELESQYAHVREEAATYLAQKTAELREELKRFVNSRVNRFSQIAVVIEQVEPFEKTATQKIKRYLYQ